MLRHTTLVCRFSEPIVLSRHRLSLGGKLEGSCTMSTTGCMRLFLTGTELEGRRKIKTSRC